MTRYGMLINTKKCVGCSACRIACQMKNHLDPEESFIKYHEIETGEYPNVYNEIVPTQCMHCEDAPCAAVCPTHATYITDSGVVLVDEEKCIGCKMCTKVCPRDAILPIATAEESGETPAAAAGLFVLPPPGGNIFNISFSPSLSLSSSLSPSPSFSLRVCSGLLSVCS